MKGYNKVIMIAIDTLRADHLGCYDHPFETSPFIDKLASEGSLFEKCYATDVPTPSSFTSLLCSERGLKNGIMGFENDYSDFNPSAPLLPENYAFSGFRTGMISNLLYSTEWLVNGFRDIHPPGLSFQGGLADEVTDEAVKWLSNYTEEDFFLFVHYWDPHVPYDLAPEKYQEMFSSEDYSDLAPNMEIIEENEWLKTVFEHHCEKTGTPRRPEEIMSLYDSEIRFTNDEIKRLFKTIEELNIDEDILVVLFSDHGETFGEYGFWDHHSCYRNISRIPLIFWAKNENWKNRIGDYIQHIDIYPTLLELSNLDVPEKIDGNSLLPLLEEKGQGRDYVVTNTDSTVIQRMYIKDDYAYVHTPQKPVRKYINEFELFDLQEDPDQTEDISEESEKILSQYRLELSDWLSDYLGELPDKLCKSAHHGCSGLNWYQEAFRDNPELASKDKEYIRQFISRFGEATRLVMGKRIRSKEDMEAHGPRSE